MTTENYETQLKKEPNMNHTHTPKIDCGCEKDVFACREHAHPHTPTPWKLSMMENWNLHGPFVNKESPCLGEIYSKSDADYIVRAVNAHEELLETVKGVKNWLRSKQILEIKKGDAWCGFEHWSDVLEQAIAKTEGK